jgi:hypothetical protein
MATLVPHPLVIRVALDFGEKGIGTLKGPAESLVREQVPEAKKAKEVGREAYLRAADASKEEKEHPDEKNELATALANQSSLPELSLFAGFLGGKVSRDTTDWRVLYLDSRLQNWLLVPEDEIVVYERLDDHHAPSKKRDALWVRGGATVVSGSGSESVEGRFLVGEFTRAGDFAATTSGGTFSAATGLLCEATTPGCYCFGSRTR